MNAYDALGRCTDGSLLLTPCGNKYMRNQWEIRIVENIVSLYLVTFCIYSRFVGISEVYLLTLSLSMHRETTKSAKMHGSKSQDVISIVQAVAERVLVSVPPALEQ